MADGSHMKRTSSNTGFVVYQDEEFGLAHDVARDLGRPSRRLSTGDTLAALISQKATKAILPFESDRNGYNTEALSTLLDFKDCVIKEERSNEDQYLLATPSFSVNEIAQAAFPGSNPAKGAFGALPVGSAAQQFYRNRVNIVYASTDAFERCTSTIDELRANGIEVRRLPGGTSAYREVLDLARQDLDPDRKVKTQVTDKGHAIISDTTAANFAKPLIGVLLPRGVAAGLTGGFNPNTGAANGSEFNSDYVVLGDELAEESKISSRFLVIERKAAPKKGGNSKPPKFMTEREKIIAKLEGITAPYARILLKVDTRGEKTGDIADITHPLIAAGVKFRPIYLHERPETLPAILEIELDMMLGATPQVKKAIGAAFERAFAKPRNHDPVLMAVYGSSTTSFSGVVQPTLQKTPWGLYAGLGVFALVMLGAVGFGLLKVLPALGLL